MTEPALVLELDEAEVEALMHYMLETVDDWWESMENGSPAGRAEFVAKREAWPDMVTGIMREVAEAYVPGSSQAFVDLER